MTTERKCGDCDAPLSPPKSTRGSPSRYCEDCRTRRKRRRNRQAIARHRAKRGQAEAPPPIPPRPEPTPIVRVVGKKPIISRELIDAVLGHIRRGLSNKDAAALVGISSSTFYKWIRWAEDGGGGKAQAHLYRQFAHEIKGALIEFQARNLELIQDAATKPAERVVTSRKIMADGTEIVETTRTQIPPGWQAGAWLLERKFPEKYGRRIIGHEGIPEPAAQDGVNIRLVFDDGDSEKKDPPA